MREDEMSDAPRRLLRSSATAEYLGITEGTLKKMRMRGDGPVYARLSPRLIIYDVADLDAWIAKNRRLSTSVAA